MGTYIPRCPVVWLRVVENEPFSMRVVAGRPIHLVLITQVNIFVCYSLRRHGYALFVDANWTEFNSPHCKWNWTGENIAPFRLHENTHSGPQCDIHSILRH